MGLAGVPINMTCPLFWRYPNLTSVNSTPAPPQPFQTRPAVKSRICRLKPGSPVLIHALAPYFSANASFLESRSKAVIRPLPDFAIATPTCRSSHAYNRHAVLPETITNIPCKATVAGSKSAPCSYVTLLAI